MGPGIKIDLSSSRRRRASGRSRRRVKFVLGPLPIDLLVRIGAVDPRAVLYTLLLKAAADTYGQPVVAGNRDAELAGLDRWQKGKVLRKLAAEGILTLERAVGSAPRVWLEPGLFRVERFS